MRDALICFIHDDRYSVPTLAFYMGADDAEARRRAQADLEASEHRAAIEVRQGDRVLFVLHRADSPTARSADEADRAT